MSCGDHSELVHTNCSAHTQRSVCIAGTLFRENLQNDRRRCAAPKGGRLSTSGAEVIVKTTRITVKPEKRTEFLQTISPLLEPIKKSKGCRTFRFYLDASDENSTLLVSEWDTETDLNNCLRSDDFAILRGAITVLSTGSNELKANVTSNLYEA